MLNDLPLVRDEAFYSTCAVSRFNADPRPLLAILPGAPQLSPATAIDTRFFGPYSAAKAFVRSLRK